MPVYILCVRFYCIAQYDVRGHGAPRSHNTERKRDVRRDGKPGPGQGHRLCELASSRIDTPG